MNKIRFLHIPKTAGSSFDESLFLLYMKDYLLRRRFIFTGNLAADLQRYQTQPANTRRHLALYLGHAPRTTGIEEVDRLPTVTFLRNPLERVKSFCQHVSEGKSSTIDPGALGPSMDLDNFLDSGRIQLNNFQSRILLGERGYDLPVLEDEELVARALQVLEQEFRGFGITEEFNRSMLLLRRALGWKKLPLYQTRNSKNTAALLTFEPRHLEKIIALNQVDLQLYDRALVLFRERIAMLGPDFERELAEYEVRLARTHPFFTVIDVARAIRKLWGSG